MTDRDSQDPDAYDPPDELPGAFMESIGLAPNVSANRELSANIAYLEDMTADLEDTIGMSSPGDVEYGGWLLHDRIQGVASRLEAAAIELHRILP